LDEHSVEVEIPLAGSPPKLLESESMMRHGSGIDPPNRFEKLSREIELDQLQWDEEYRRAIGNRRIEYLSDDSQSIVSQNNSPDIPFRYSLNPYRGCAHGCSYCYARPTHEYLGLSAGLDFETKIVVKKNAPELLRAFLRRTAWQPEPITFSGVTDCYQPAEREFRLTRGCLEVAAEFGQPVSIVTKNALVVRDLDVLIALAARDLVHVFVSITTLDEELASQMEPRTSTAAARLRAIGELAKAGIPVGVMVAPVIPGLNDSEVPAILQQAKQAGAAAAGYVLLRLPGAVAPVFEEWLRRTQPLRAERILGRIAQTRGGALNQSTFGQRMIGKGILAEQIQQLFRKFRDSLGLLSSLPEHARHHFRRPDSGQVDQQLRLF
jgi:DNA repair photolyase